MNNPPLSPYKSTWMVYGHLIVNIQRLVVELGIVGQLLHGPCGGFATTTRFGSGDLGSLSKDSRKREGKWWFLSRVYDVYVKNIYMYIYIYYNIFV